MEIAHVDQMKGRDLQVQSFVH